MKEEANLNENEFSNFPSEKLISNDNKTRKIIIIALILIIFIAILITIILIIASNSNSSESSEIDEVAEINCNYNIQAANEEIDILGEDFIKMLNLIFLLMRLK